eukprot:scaffold17766_cov54-Attheya_sp.AAC.6
MSPLEMSSSFATGCALSLLCGTKTTRAYDTTERQIWQTWMPRRDEFFEGLAGLKFRYGLQLEPGTAPGTRWEARKRYFLKNCIDIGRQFEIATVAVIGEKESLVCHQHHDDYACVDDADRHSRVLRLGRRISLRHMILLQAT